MTKLLQKSKTLTQTDKVVKTLSQIVNNAGRPSPIYKPKLSSINPANKIIQTPV